MKTTIIFIILLLSNIVSFSQGKDPCKPPGDPEGRPGCPDPTEPCVPLPPGKSIPVLRAVDPNEIIGPTGYLKIIGNDTIKWVSGKQTLPYKILFENDPDFATAPAQNIRVELPIHAKLNLSSFRVGDFGFANMEFSVPANTVIYTKRLDVRDSLQVYVDVTAGIDVANRKAFWVLQAIDPATGLSTTVPANLGVLPVNDSLSHRGEGLFTLTLLPISTVQTKDTITAQASIIFDTEETIVTNKWVNIVDAVAPTSNVSNIASIDGNTARVTWTGQDDANGVGIDFYDLYVSQNNAAFQLYETRINANTYDFKGSSGASYKFFTLATDLVGNKEALKSSAANSVFLGIAPPTIIASRDTACATQAITLTATNCTGTVTWSNSQTGSSINVTITSDTEFTANCTDGSNASNESSPIKVVYGGLIPSAQFTGTQTINVGEIANLDLSFTGASPWFFILNADTVHNILNSPYQYKVTPNFTTNYVLKSVGNACGIFEINTNNTVTVNVNPPVITTSNITGSPFCAGTNLNISFTATGTFGIGNVFTAQLSDSTGSFVTPVNIGTLTSTATLGTIPSIIPANTLPGTQYRIRIISSNSSINGTDNGSDLTIRAKANAVLTGTQTINLGETVAIKATMTGTPPFIITINGDLFANINSPFYWPVSPTQTTTYTLFSVTDVCGTVNITSDNVAVVTVNTACTKPDLIISDVTITKYTPTRINYTAQIKNTGLINASMGSFFLGVYTSSDDLLNSNDVWKYSITTGGGTLAPNQTLSFSYNTSFSFTDNQYYLRLKADELGLITECSETNNDFFKLVNKCSTTGNLNITGNISSGYYSTNQAVTISNAALSNNVLVVGKSISGSPSLAALNSVFMVGGCLNEPVGTASSSVANVSQTKEKPILEFLETDSNNIIEFTLSKNINSTIYIWNATTKEKVATIQENANSNKGLNSMNLSAYNLNTTDLYILNIETPEGIFAKGIDN